MFKEKRAQELTQANKLTRLVRAKQLLKSYPQHLVHFIWFTDEKVFTVAAPKNPQDNRLYVNVATKKKEVGANHLLRTRTTYVLKVGDGICRCVDSRLHRVDLCRAWCKDKRRI